VEKEIIVSWRSFAGEKNSTAEVLEKSPIFTIDIDADKRRMIALKRTRAQATFGEFRELPISTLKSYAPET